MIKIDVRKMNSESRYHKMVNRKINLYIIKYKSKSSRYDVMYNFKQDGLFGEIKRLTNEL